MLNTFLVFGAKKWCLFFFVTENYKKKRFLELKKIQINSQSKRDGRISLPDKVTNMIVLIFALSLLITTVTKMHMKNIFVEAY